MPSERVASSLVGGGGARAARRQRARLPAKGIAGPLCIADSPRSAPGKSVLKPTGRRCALRCPGCGRDAATLLIICVATRSKAERFLSLG